MPSLRPPETVRTTAKKPITRPLSLLTIVIAVVLAGAPAIPALEFLHNPFDPNSNGTEIILTSDAHFDGSFLRFTNDSHELSLGRAFHTSRLAAIHRQNQSSNSSSSPASSFSTSFVFSILPQISTSPGFGLCFFLCNTSSPPGALASQYFGLFSNATRPSIFPLVGVKFDTGRNTDFNDPDDNHIGINLNNIESAATESAGFYNTSGEFVPIRMRDGTNVRAWIDFDGETLTFNVTVAPAGLPRPARPTLSYTEASIADYLSDSMFFGFSASKTEWNESQRVLAWSFSDVGPAPEINTTGFPTFRNPETSSPPLSPAEIAGISAGVAAAVLVVLCLAVIWIIRRRRKMSEEEGGEEMEEWEMEYWPHRFEYEELSSATTNFSGENLLGSGGFGKVYKGVLSTGSEVAVKCVNHDSKQGLREFMAEISSMGRLQHKNLVPMRGWCKKGGILLLVYDYMPNGSLNRWIFDRPREVLSWQLRRRVLGDVAEGLSYLHHGYDQVVVHRDIKSSNILLDSDMRARLGDFGLAKLYSHGEVPNTTRVVGTPGYLAPELASSATSTAASDVYSFGVVVLEVACGRRPIELGAEEEEVVLVDWVRDLYVEGRVGAAADQRVRDECGAGELEMMLKLGLACCHPDPLRRPGMREVVAVLVGEGAAAAPAEVLLELSGGGPAAAAGGDGGEELALVG